MTLLKHTYATPVERAIEDVRLDPANYPIGLDDAFAGENIAAAELLGTLVGADLFSTVLGAEYAAKSVQHAMYMRLHRGTPAALNRFAEIAGLRVSYEVSGNQITYQIVPPISTGTHTTPQEEFIIQALQILTPMYFTVTVVETVDQFEGFLYVSGSLDQEEILE